MSLNGTEWSERGYGLWRTNAKTEQTRLCPLCTVCMPSHEAKHIVCGQSNSGMTTTSYMTENLAMRMLNIIFFLTLPALWSCCKPDVGLVHALSWPGQVSAAIREYCEIGWKKRKRVVLKKRASFCFAILVLTMTADPCVWLMDPDADLYPAIFNIDLQDPNKKLTLKKSFSAYYFLKVLVHLHNFSKIKSPKEVTKQ